MQPPFSCAPLTYASLESSLSSGRLGRYFGAAGGDKNYALRLYVWNGRLCEAFYIPMQLAEVSVRNTIQKALGSHFGPDWYKRGGFTCTLPQRLSDKLTKAVQDARSKYGAAMTADHVVAELSFGFWVNLTTQRYDAVLWPKFYSLSWPHKPDKIKRTDIYARLERFRSFRNRIAHHGPIFDRSPKAEYQNVLTLLEWICGDTRWFAIQIARIDQVLNSKPARL